MSFCIESIVQQSSDDLVQASGGYARTGRFTSSATAPSHRPALQRKRRETRECLMNGAETAPKRTRGMPPARLPESQGVRPPLRLQAAQLSRLCPRHWRPVAACSNGAGAAG
jgi:hypothetical protein